MSELPEKFAICGVQLYDGLGSEEFQADVAVADGRIAAIGKTGELNLAGITQINGNGLALAPGFIDIHTHSDTDLINVPDAPSKIAQGVTLEVVGNCGTSPCIDKKKDWHDLASYAEELNRRQPVLNIAALCGHSTLRSMAMGFENRRATDSEISRMQELLALALKQGAGGLSSGLIYMPGMFADTEELCRLVSVLKNTGKAYFTHMRSEGDQLLEAVQEAFTIAEAGDGILDISHLKTLNPANWHKVDALLELIRGKQRQGLKITADRYPYIYTGTSMQAHLPAPYNSTHELWKQLASPEEQEKLRGILVDQYGYELEHSILCGSANPAHTNLLGLTFAEIAVRQHRPPADVLVEMLTEPDCYHVAYKSLNQENLIKIYREDWVMPGSDGHSLPLDYSTKRAHPRSFGTFPRYFQLCREFLPTRELVRRMTSLPASVLKVKDRGVLKTGAIADLVLFDPEHYASRSDFEHPHTLADGIGKVFVNGRLAYNGIEQKVCGRHGHFVAL